MENFIAIKLTQEQLNDLTDLVANNTEYENQGSYWYDIYQELATAKEFTKEELLEEAVGLLYILEDKTGYKNDNLGKAINLLQSYKIKE